MKEKEEAALFHICLVKATLKDHTCSFAPSRT